MPSLSRAIQQRTHIKHPFRLSGRVVLPWMAGTLALYIAVHSPLRETVAGAFGMLSRGCFFCTYSININEVFEFISGLWLILIACMASWFIAIHFKGPDYDKLLAFGLYAFALIVIPAAMFGEIADRLGLTLLKPPPGPILASLPAVGLVVVGFKSGWRPRLPHLSIPSSSLANWLAILGGGTLMASIAIELMHPATSGDALSYHSPLAIYLWQDGNLGSFLDRAPDIWALAHPGMAELWYGLLHTIGGEPLADLGQLPFTLLGILAIYAFTRRLGLRSGAAWLGGLAFLFVPIVVLQSTMQPNDIVGAALLMGSMALASAPKDSWNSNRAALTGLALGLATTTKLALLPSVAGAAIFTVCAISLPAFRTKSWRPSGFSLTLLVLMFLLAVSPWWTRNILRYQNPIFPSAIPFLGRGVFLGDLGRIDSAFVPSPAAWPLYPLIEPYDDRSGFSALFLVSAIPGFLIALQRARRRGLALLGLVTAVTLPAWWIFTLHEPRFFLGLVGLTFTFIPWTLLATPRHLRWAASLLLGVAALFSTLVTWDQGLLPFARQTNERVAFYNQVWGVDPAATSLPENEGILLNTGFAPSIFEYTAFYPLLGPHQSRLVIPLDGTHSTANIAEEMRRNGIKYAYVAASPQNQEAVEAQFNPAFFDLIHESNIVVGEQIAARRYLYRPAEQSELANATRRYLFQLK
jgi:hypothetical protein